MAEFDYLVVGDGLGLQHGPGHERAQRGVAS
jgi:hypothetical protein